MHMHCSHSFFLGPFEDYFNSFIRKNIRRLFKLRLMASQCVHQELSFQIHAVKRSSKRFVFFDLKCFNHSDVSVSPTGLRRAP